MQEVKGYYDGEKIVTLDKLDAKPNQMLTIIVQDNYLKEKEDDEAEIQRKLEALEHFGGACKGIFEGVDGDEHQRKLKAIDDFFGCGKGVFDEVDPDEYVRKLRAEWDEREACHE